MSNNPYAAPRASLQETVHGYRGGDVKAYYLSKLAEATCFGRAAIVAIGLSAVLVFFCAAIAMSISLKPSAAIGFLVAIPMSTIPTQATATGQLVKLLGKEHTQGGVATFLALLPALGLIPLVAAIKLGAKELAKHGVQVGVFGPSKEEVARLQAAVIRSTSEATYVEPLKTTSAPPQTSADTHQA